MEVSINNYIKENRIKRYLLIIIAVSTLLMTLSQYWSNSLSQSVIEKQNAYGSQLLEFYSSVSDFDRNQDNSNLQTSNWFNCLNLKDTVYCSTISEMVKMENDNKNSSFTRLIKKGEKYNQAVKEYELARKRQEFYSFYLNIMFYVPVFVIFILTLRHRKENFD